MSFVDRYDTQKDGQKGNKIEKEIKIVKVERFKCGRRVC